MNEHKQKHKQEITLVIPTITSQGESKKAREALRRSH